MPLTVNENTYIYPPRPEGALPRGDHSIFADLGWIAQYKYNDTRCLIKFRTDGRIQLWNRHAEIIQGYNAPIELQEQLEQIRAQLGPGYHLLDGGLLDKKHPSIKNTIVIWDILVQNGEHLIGTTYQERYDKLTDLTTGLAWVYSDDHRETCYAIGSQITQDIFTPTCWEPKNWNKCWSLIDSINHPWLNKGNGPVLEGIMMKDPTGTLGHGFREKNNSEWQMRSRITTGRHRF